MTETEKIVGTNKFFGEIWKALLRTPRCALAAIKYLDRKIPKDKDVAAANATGPNGKIYVSQYGLKIKNGVVILESQTKFDEQNKPYWYKEEQAQLQKLIEEKDQEAYFYFYYPNKARLCNNSLQAGLSTVEQTVYVNRAVLDFMISHMPITSRINSLEENVRLLEVALLTLPKRDFAIQKKFFTWFSSHLEDVDDDNENQETIREHPAILAVIPALQRILTKFLSVKTDKAQQNPLAHDRGHQAQRNPLKNIDTPMQIMTVLFNDSSFNLEHILSKISVDMIRFVKFFTKSKTELERQSNAKQKNMLEDKVQSLFQVLNDYHHVLWSSLGTLLSDEVGQLSKDEKQHRIEAIELITFCLRSLSPERLENEQKNEFEMKEALD